MNILNNYNAPDDDYDKMLNDNYDNGKMLNDNYDDDKMLNNNYDDNKMLNDYNDDGKILNDDYNDDGKMINDNYDDNKMLNDNYDDAILENNDKKIYSYGKPQSLQLLDKKDKNQSSYILFSLIKNNEWELLKKTIINDTSFTIDYLIKDNKQMTILEYLIQYDKPTIIELVLNKPNIYIDYLTRNGKSLLYNIIKNNQTEILKIFLNKNYTLIGKNILNILDKDKFSPIFYTIQFKNLKCLELILNQNTWFNFYSVNNEGNNVVCYAIENLDENDDECKKILKLLLKKYNNINIPNNNGETLLHLTIRFERIIFTTYILNQFSDSINFNAVEYKYDFSILHYLCIFYNYNIFEQFTSYIKNKKINVNMQDALGKTPYYYFLNSITENENNVKDDNVKDNKVKNISNDKVKNISNDKVKNISNDKVKNISNDKVKNISNNNDKVKNIIKTSDILLANFDYNLFDINGEIVCHIIFKNYEKIKSYTNIVKNILLLSNINIQNNYGISCFVLLVKMGLIDEFYDILVNKKLDIFVIFSNEHNDEKNDEHIFNYVRDMDKFIKLITTSYLNQLTLENDSSIFVDSWDKKCSKISTMKLNETDIKVLKELNISRNDSKKTICYNVIESKIKNSINTFISKNITNNTITSYSYPIKTDEIKVTITEYPKITKSTYMGTTLEIVCGLIYLHKKYKKITTSLNSINEKKSNLINCNSLTKVCEVIGFNIIWINNELKGFTNNDPIYNLFNKTSSGKLVIPLSIEITINGNTFEHLNYLIMDFDSLELERFEHHGSNCPHGFNYNPTLLDKTIEYNVVMINSEIKYFKPINYLPKIGFQVREINESNNFINSDPDGCCSLWCVWWCDMRLSNKLISREKLVKLLFKEIINQNKSYKNMIRNFGYLITNIRDNLFNNIGLSFNLWKNNDINDKQLDALNKSLYNAITT